MLEPARTFLGCLPLGVGAKLMLWFHLAACAVSCSMAMGNLLLNMPSFGYATSSTAQVFSAVWSLAGVPIILAALYGAYQRVEPHVRFYSYYLAVCVVIDVVYVVNLLVIQDACSKLDASTSTSGKAFACGVARTLSATGAIVTTVVLCYMLYVIWSFCEELHGGGCCNAIADLLYAAEDRKKRMRLSTASDMYGADYSAVERSMPMVGGRPQHIDYGASYA